MPSLWGDGARQEARCPAVKLPANRPFLISLELGP